MNELNDHIVCLVANYRKIFNNNEKYRYNYLYLLIFMVKKISEEKGLSLFTVFFKSGTIVFIFGVTLIIIDLIVHSFTEGLRFMGTDFAIAGAITIIIAYIYKYHKILGFLMIQLKMKINKQNRSSEWYKP